MSGEEQGIVDKLASRKPEATICPSEVSDDMPAVRAAAKRLVERGTVEITQKGEVVDLDEAKGPIRIRRGPAWDE